MTAPPSPPPYPARVQGLINIMLDGQTGEVTVQRDGSTWHLRVVRADGEVLKARLSYLGEP